MRHILPRAWYSSANWVKLLYPLSLLYRFFARRNRAAYTSGSKPVYRPAVPVIVIGNITVGGTGKTPLTLAIAEFLQVEGLRPAIITRGYKGKSTRYPLWVNKTTPVTECGDEAMLLAMNTTVPVIVDPQRSRAARFLESNFMPDVILCDDGLQHYALARDIEIVVIDGERGFGNGLLLPAGPLREPPARLSEVDFVVINGKPLATQLPANFAMVLQARQLINLVTGTTILFSPAALFGKELVVKECPGKALSDTSAAQKRTVHALAGIGNPGRFFSLLQSAGFDIIPRAYPDHHHFTKADIDFADDLPVLMTEKDAVKCAGFATEAHWYLKVAAQLPPGFWSALTAKLAMVRNSVRAADSADFH